MSKKSKFAPVEPNEEDLALFSKQYLNLGEVNTAIEKLELEIPDKRKKKEYEEWKIKINFLIDMYNNLASFKSFKRYE